MLGGGGASGQWLLFVLATLLFSLALMRPRWFAGKVPVPAQGVDIVLCIDVSHSMLCEDIKPSRLEPGAGEPSAHIRQRVIKARERQRERCERMGLPFLYNAQLPPKLLREVCPLDGEAKELLRTAIQSLGLSARAHDRIVKVARTIADLEGSEVIRPRHIAEAITYRSLDRRWLEG